MNLENGQFLSNENNCIMFNTLLNNSQGFEWADIFAFQQFRSTFNATQMQLYYDRSERLVKLIKTIQGNTTQTWNNYKTMYVDSFINSVGANNYEQAYTQIFSMLDAIETEFGVTGDVILGGMASSAYMPFVTTAGQTTASSLVLVIKEDVNSINRKEVTSVRTSVQPLVTLVTTSGKRLTCSTNTIMTLEYGMTCYASEAQGKFIPTQSVSNSMFGKVEWELCTEVNAAGTGEIVTIVAPRQCIAAGDVDQEWIFTGRLEGNKGY
jgi:hypothetical protein